jgi:hypothetical protein
VVPSERLRVLEAEEEVLVKDNDEGSAWGFLVAVILIVFLVSMCSRRNERELILDKCLGKDAPPTCTELLKGL